MTKQPHARNYAKTHILNRLPTDWMRVAELAGDALVTKGTLREAMDELVAEGRVKVIIHGKGKSYRLRIERSNGDRQ